MPYAVRLTAGAAAPVAASGYVEAAAAGGERLWYLVVREILPNLRATLLALFGLRFVAAVYLVATAGFLQVGPQPPRRRLGVDDPRELLRHPAQPLGRGRPPASPSACSP
ncbi:ABC transporter permease subunit [Streptomyces tricolor]|nr:ABC transporter permease subunit [Streptomyces tricolor]